MTSKEEIAVVDYLRLLQAGDLSHEEICEVLKVNPKAMSALLGSAQMKTLIFAKTREFRMTFSDRWNTVDEYIKSGFSDDEIASFLNFPLRQVQFRRHFIQKGIIK